MERLLFDKAGLPAFADNSYQCRLNASISQYLADLGKHTAMEWQDYATSFSSPGMASAITIPMLKPAPT
ncbi:hypothetical protein [Aliamphritea spongicola]|nr:hypothetical protein [Aliamphritea spongicola]